MDQQKSSVGVVVVAIVVTALVVGGGMYWWQTSKVTPQTNTYEQIVKFNCEQSGGEFSESKCQCQEEPKVNGAPAFTYGERDGYCVDSFGTPGGDLGETVKNLQEFQMLKSQ
ncbi:hypothetical protein KKD80_00670 [Patescibacteria group bacterium]|nr:hypothetical protein [Patescibacteria group bacterium]